MNEFIKIVITIIIAIISGAIGSLIAPWVHWGIEKKRLKLSARRKLIENVRDFLEESPDKEEFQESVIYSKIKPFISQKTQKKIEDDVIHVCRGGGRGGGVNNYSHNVLDELCVLEKEWKLL